MSSTGREQDALLPWTQDMPAITAGRTHLGFGFFGSIGVLPFTLRDLFCSDLLAALGGAGFLHPAFLQGRGGEQGGGKVTGKFPALSGLHSLQQVRHIHHGVCAEEPGRQWAADSGARLSQNMAKTSTKKGW